MTAFRSRSVVLVAPTSTSKPASFRPEIDIGALSRNVLVEQVGAVEAQGFRARSNL
jgi:hypothetical protein